MAKPIIGIVPRTEYVNTNYRVQVNYSYLEPFNKRDITPIILPLNSDNVLELLPLCDGFLVTGGNDNIEYAAEIALEHHLGLTCDPICGLVQIPCIERNAVAAMRAINAANLADLLFDTRKISFDKVVIAMKETGDDMSPAYKETSEAGLAKIAVE